MRRKLCLMLFIEKYRALVSTAVYREPLYAVLTIGGGKLKVEGVKSEFVGPGMDERVVSKGGKLPTFFEEF